MIDGGKHAGDEQSDADLRRSLRETGRDGGQADPDEEDAHHAVFTPLVGNPARGHGEETEGEETWRRVGQQFRIADAPLDMEYQGRDRRKDQREQMVEQRPDVQQQKIRLIPIHRLDLLHSMPARYCGP